MANSYTDRQLAPATAALRNESSWIYKLKRSRNLWPLINIMGLITWIFSMAGTFHCSFIMIEPLKQSPSTATLTTNTSAIINHPVGLGLFSTSVYDTEANLLGCVSYYGTSDEFDGAFRASRTFGMIATLCASIAVICVTLVTLFVESLRDKVNLWSVARFLFFAAFLSQLLTFLAFGRDLCSRNDMVCRPGPAGILTVLNLVLLSALSALIYVVPPVKSPLFLLRKGRPIDQQSVPSFEIVSKITSSEEQPEDAGLDIDLESESETQTQEMIVEGIECVAADHLQRDRARCLDSIVNKYYAIGRKKSTRKMIAVLLCISWVFTIVGSTRCTFMLVGAKGQDRNDFSGLGLFSRAYYMNDDILGCIAYPPAGKKEFDAPFHVARAFGMMTIILMTVAFTSFFVLHGFIEYSQRKELAWWSCTQITLPAAFFFQMVTFSAFKTQSCTQLDNVDCVPGVAGIFAILNAIVLSGLAILIFALPCPTSSIFRIRKTPPRRIPHPPSESAKFQARQHKNQRMENQQDGPQDGNLPEPSSTHSISDHSGGGQQAASPPRFAVDPPAINESVEVITRIDVDENDGTRTTTKEIHNPDGSITITTTVQHSDHRVHVPFETAPTASQATPNRSAQGMTGNSSFSMGPRSTPAPTLTSGMPTGSSSGPAINQAPTWDSGASVEQFETVDMDTSNASSCASVIARNGFVRAAASTQTDSVQDARCCLVQSTAMSILKEMQEEEVERKRQQQQQQQQQPPQLAAKPSWISGVGPGLVRSARRRAPPGEFSFTQLPQDDSSHSTLIASNSSQKTATTRGGRLNPGSATTKSSDAVGGATTTSLETYSKISSTEYGFGSSDDGITYNTGEAINNDDAVSESRPRKAFI